LFVIGDELGDMEIRYFGLFKGISLAFSCRYCGISGKHEHDSNERGKKLFQPA
jgi:hypothetical protein